MWGVAPPPPGSATPNRCRANVAHERQSRPHSGFGCQKEPLKRFTFFPLHSPAVTSRRLASNVFCGANFPFVKNPHLFVTTAARTQTATPKPQTPNPIPPTPNPSPQTPFPILQTPNTKQQTPNLEPRTLKPQTPNHRPQTRCPKPESQT